MGTLTVLAWLASAWILAAYMAASTRPRRLRGLHVANVVGAAILGFYNAAHSAWPTVDLNVAYGLIAATALIDDV